jgi:predicted regulator of Ras-like GTPase activity (Roadblock/LC7/MglB family)
MPTIRDLVGVLRQREGVDAAIVLGRDGLLIDSSAESTVDADSIAALVPSIVAAAEELGRQSNRGSVTTAVLEYPEGIAIVSSLSAEAMLLVLARPSAQVGRLLFELRRHRENIAALV